MVLAAQIALILFVCFFVFSPLVTHRGEKMWVETREEEKRRAIRERKERLYSGVVDLDFDRDSGKLSTEDHARMRGELMKDVLAVLQEEDALDGGERPRPSVIEGGDHAERMILEYKHARRKEAEARGT